MGPYGSALTDAVADVNEKHRKLMIAPTAATTSILGRNAHRNCSFYRADDLLQTAVGHSDGDRLTRARVKQGNGHIDLPQLNSPSRRAVCHVNVMCPVP